MELKATSMGKRLARHPYNRVRLMAAGVEVSGDKHEYLIPFNQLLDIACKRGVVWGELEFLLADEKVVRLHGTEWQETQRFYHYLLQAWQSWSLEMSAVCRDVLQTLRDDIEAFSAQDRWLNRHELQALKNTIIQQFDALPLPLSRLKDFADCRENQAFCERWLEQGEAALRQRNRDWTAAMLTRYRAFFDTVESTPLNQSQCEAVVNGEDSLLVLAGAGSGKTSVLVARAGWLMQRNLASADQILLLAFGRQAAEEMNARIQSRLSASDIQARTFHSLALHIIREGSNKQPVISKLESDADSRRALLIQEWQQQCHEKRPRPTAGANGCVTSWSGRCRRGHSGRMTNWLSAWRPGLNAGWV